MPAFNAPALDAPTLDYLKDWSLRTEPPFAKQGFVIEPQWSGSKIRNIQEMKFVPEATKTEFSFDAGILRRFLDVKSGGRRSQSG